MARTVDCLGRAEAHLTMLTRGREQDTLDRWRDASDALATLTVDRPTELQAWIRERPASHADDALRGLVQLAQRGDLTALLATLVCLAPGIRALARRTGVSLDEAMSEVSLGVLEFPHARRSSVAGGLLLDARNRITRSARRAPMPVQLTEDAPTQQVPAEPTAAERVLAVICEARRRHELNHDDAQLIVDTRLSGQRVAPAAARLGISAAAAYQRRTRAEQRLHDSSWL